MAKNPAAASGIFRSWFLGGFECSTHRRKDGRRLDLASSTLHDRFAAKDYARLAEVGMRCARDGVRWHLVEKSPGSYDWSSAVGMIRASRETQTQIAWDLLHFGWPDGLDVFSGAFPDRFGRFVRAFLDVLGSEDDRPPLLAPVNEISFLSFAAGQEGFFFPYGRKRGDEIKAQLVRAAIAACDAILEKRPDARILHTDPIIHIQPNRKRGPQDRAEVERHNNAQYAAWDMIAGRARRQLGGQPRYLDVIGVNYYIHNQWINHGHALPPNHPEHVPLRFLLRNVFERYRRPFFIAETGIEASARPGWLRYVGREARAAERLGVPLEGICLYPIVNHPGWDDDRHCPNGLWDYADENGDRPIYGPLAAEILRQEAIREGRIPPDPEDEPISEDLEAAAHQMEVLTDRSR